MSAGIRPRGSPLIDVVLPAYNGSRVIRKALDSALAQEVPLRIVVVDDGSSDDSAAIARSYGDQVTVITQANRGVSGARNTGIAATQAPYIALLDQDDVWLPGKLARQLALIEAHPDVGIVFTDMRVERPDGTVVEDGYLLATEPYAALERTPLGDDAYMMPPSLGEAVIRFNFISPSSTLVRRTALSAIGGFDEAFRLADDVECWMRLLVHWRAIAIQDCLVRYLLWDGSASRMFDRMIRERLAIGEKTAGRPELYLPGTADYFRRERPVSLYRLGVIDLHAGAMNSARDRFRESLREEWRLTTALAFGATFLPGSLRRGLLRLKRATGVRWRIRVE